MLPLASHRAPSASPRGKGKVTPPPADPEKSGARWKPAGLNFLRHVSSDSLPTVTNASNMSLTVNSATSVPSSFTMSMAGRESHPGTDKSASSVAFSGYYPFSRRRPQSRLTSATSVMDDRYLGALHRHYRLLMTHITLTDDIIEQMARGKILPETMIKDIQTAESKEEKNECLLNSLRLRGNNSYKKFRELMYRTGNFFVADLLWEEDDPSLSVEEDDLGRFPGLLDCLQEEHRKRLVQYLESKVREKALQLAWREAPRERKQALFTKASNFSQEKLFRETINDQEQKMKALQAIVQDKEGRVRELQVELKTQQEQVTQIRREHRTVLDTQTKFHDANISTIAKLRGRMTNLKERAGRLNKAVAALLDVEEGGSVRDEEEDAFMGRLEISVQKLADRVRTLECHVQSADKQRDDLLTLLNRRGSKDTLVSTVKDVLRHEQRHRAIVMRDIVRLGEVLKQVPHAHSKSAVPDPAILETKHFKNELAMLKAEAEHLHKRLSWKESEINDLQQEMRGLRQQGATETESSLSATASSSTTSGSSQSSVAAQNHPDPSASPARAPHPSSLRAPSGPSTSISTSTGANSVTRKPPQHGVPAQAARAKSSITYGGAGAGAGAGAGERRGQGGTRIPAPAKRSTLKTVTFRSDANSSSPSPASSPKRASVARSGAGLGLEMEMGLENGDLDKTHVDVDQYLHQARKMDAAGKGEGDMGT